MVGLSRPLSSHNRLWQAMSHWPVHLPQIYQDHFGPGFLLLGFPRSIPPVFRSGTRLPELGNNTRPQGHDTTHVFDSKDSPRRVDA